VIDTCALRHPVARQLLGDDTVNPTGGGTLIYGYNRLTQPAAAATRALNTEYIPGTAKRTQITANLKVWGSAFEIDRVLANLGSRDQRAQIPAESGCDRRPHEVSGNGHPGRIRRRRERSRRAQQDPHRTTTEANTSSALDILAATAVDTQAEALLARIIRSSG